MNQQRYTYTYSAAQQEEIKTIRQKYLSPQEDPMTRLRKLDAATTRKGTTLALTLGIISSLVLGLGMSCCMVWAGHWFLPGIGFGLLGMSGIAAAYPLYRMITQKERQKAAPEILRLTEELMK